MSSGATGNAEVEGLYMELAYNLLDGSYVCHNYLIACSRIPSRIENRGYLLLDKFLEVLCN